MYPYPEGVGIIIPATQEKSSEVNNSKFENTIVTIFGLPSTGKSTVSELVAERLGLPLFDTGVLYRTFAYFKLNYIDEVNLATIADFKSSILLEAINGKVEVSLKNKVLTASEIRNSVIDKEMGNYTKLPEVRAAVDELVANFVKLSSFVTNGRGANDGYLLQAESQGIKVIRVLLQAEQKERIRRRFIDYINLERGHNLDETVVQNLWKTCEEVVKLRDEEEIIKEKTLNLGMVTAETGVLDTTDLSIDQVVQSILSWVKSSF